MVKPATHSGFYITIDPTHRAKEMEIENMALTRKLLKGMGLTEEQIDSIIDAHVETVDALKAYKSDAEKLKDVQKELEDLKAKGDDGWKDKHDKVKKEFDDFKKGIETKEARASKEAALKSYFESKNITGKNLNIAMRGCAGDIDALELDGDKIKDTKAIDALISGDFADLVSTTQTKGSDPATPPGGTGGNATTKEQIMAITDRKARREAIAKNRELFQGGTN